MIDEIQKKINGACNNGVISYRNLRFMCFN